MKVSLWAEIRRLHEIEHLSSRAIVRHLHCCGKTVAKALAMTQPPTGKPQPRGSILDRYHGQIEALIAKYPHVSAVRVREEIAKGAEGYRGSVGLVRRLLRQIRPARGRVYQEVLYEPGEAMQVDWGDCGRLMVGQTPRRVSVFVAVLCYSRLCYIEFSLSQRKAEFYRALVHALEFFQGSPGKVILTTLRQRSSAVRGAMPVCIPSSWPCAATSAWNRSPARHATRNRKESSREGCGMSNTVPWRAAARN